MLISLAIALFLGIYARIELTLLNTFFLLGVMIGSILPDADHKNAPIGRIIPVWIFFKHRTITHSLIPLIVISVVFKIYYKCININSIYSYLVYGLVFGILIHILSDIFTSMGCPIFYPISKVTYNLDKIKVGGYKEVFIRIGSLLIVFAEIIYIMYTRL